ncbi:hypothetical protein VTH06DRAFT_1753 [Thermothelomyces fergusii]
MSSIVNQVAGGGSAASEQSGTGPSVTEGPLSSDTTSLGRDSETKDVHCAASVTSIDQVVDAEHVSDDDDDDNSGLDFIFGGNSDLKGAAERSREDGNDNSKWLSNSNGNNNRLHDPAGSKSSEATQPSVKKTDVGSAHSSGELPASDHRLVAQVTPDLLTFPTITPKSGEDSRKPSFHEESLNNARSYIASETPPADDKASNQSSQDSALSISGTRPSSVPDTGSHLAETSSNVPRGDSAPPPSESSGEFDGLSDGYIPTASFSGSIIFGPELQNALFVGGEASVDPQLPGPDGPSDAAASGSEPVPVAPATLETKITVPTTPQRPPAGPPRLVNIPMAGPPVHPFDGPASHNSVPPKPDTPLADQLRADFWVWYHRDTQHFLAYKKTFREWAAVGKNEPGRARADHDPATAERLKAAAIGAQVAWAEHHAAFERWKAANPAVGPIVANAHQDTRALRAAERQKAERADFVRTDLRGKPERQRQRELARYDHFARLVAQSREREMWRSRVEALVKAEAMIEEQSRLAAAAAAAAAAATEEARRKAEAEELERRRKEAEAEEQRKLAEARAGKEEERLLREKHDAARATQAAEKKEKAEEHARREAEAQRLADESILLQIFGFPETNRSGGLHNAQQRVQENYVSDKRSGPVSSESIGSGETQTAQNDSAFQFADDLLLPSSHEPLNFDDIFAEQDAVLLPGGLPAIDVPTAMQLDAALANEVAHPQLFHGLDNQAVLAQAKDISAEQFPLLAQPQIQSSLEAMSPNGAGQPETIGAQVSAESSTGKKRPSRKRANPKARSKATANPKCVQKATASKPQQPLSEPSFGLGQVMALDPFIASASTNQPLSNSQGMLDFGKSDIDLTLRDDSAAVSPAGQVSHVAEAAVEGMEHQPFRTLESPGPSRPEMQQRLSQMSVMELSSYGNSGPRVQQPPQGPSDYTIFMKQPSQAPSPASMSSAQAPSTTHISAHAGTNLSSDNKRKASTPQQQIPIDPALHYGISPPSGGMRFGTSIKAGVCAAIAHVVKEAKLGTVFSQVLLDGPIADFGCPEISGRIKQVTKSHLIAVSAAEPEDDRQAFLSGAFRVLQGILHEIEEHGSVFGKALLDGQMSGAALMPARKAMSTVYKTVMAEYQSPPRPKGNLARPTRSPNHAYPSPPSFMAGYIVPDCQQPAASKPAALQRSNPAHDVPEPTNYYPQEQQQLSEPQQRYGQVEQTSKKASARRKSRSRKSSTPAVTANSQPPTDDNTVATTPSTTATTAAAAAAGGPTPSSLEPTPPPASGEGYQAAAAATTTEDTQLTSNTGSSSGSAQCVPKLYYRFADGAFYMQLQTASGEATHHRIGAKGTTAAEAALDRFRAAAAARLGAEARCPPGFVFRAWEGVDENLRALERALGLPDGRTGERAANGQIE